MHRSKNGVLVEEYRYNANGSRIYEMNALRGISGRDLVYSDEDHLLTAGNVSYSYDLDGFLQTRTDGADVTTYEYSSRGELLGVTLPDGTVIGYLHDPWAAASPNRSTASLWKNTSGPAGPGCWPYLTAPAT